MNLASLLGDDEHTGKDDAYSRILKSRKWLVLSSALAIGWAHGMIKPSPFTVAVADVTLPAWVWLQALLTGLGYSGAIYGLLLVQLAVRYPQVLRDRLLDRSGQRLQELRERHEQLNQSYFENHRALYANEMEAELKDVHEQQLVKILDELRTVQFEMSRVSRDRVNEDLFYVLPEMAIDAARVLTPALFGIIAAAHWIRSIT